jgi:hypothetical protein
LGPRPASFWSILPAADVDGTHLIFETPVSSREIGFFALSK